MTDPQGGTALLDRPPPRRGGNRLPADRYRSAGPDYDRITTFGHDHERRDRHQKVRTQQAIAEAVRRGTLPRLLAMVLTQLLALCADSLLEPAPDRAEQCSGWWSLRFIHDLVLPVLDSAGVPIPASDREGGDEHGARTAGRWMKALFELGWIEKVHRWRIVNGQVIATSNLWRIRIPTSLRTEIHDREDASRSRARANRQTNNHAKPGRTTRPGSTRPGRANHAEADRTAAAAAAQHAQAEDIRDRPCPTCDGNKWVPAADGISSTGCEACGGTVGRAGSGTARAGP
ncbi:MAG: hypothetical protein M3010_09495 [Candidatus Dormibacteraeota bacterium]|nr:hypothetical protein [Candidatus Dormibacteraeota bacterium]